ncbi:MAG: metallophosphoesterase family protein [Acidimicrobiales bacterium]
MRTSGAARLGVIVLADTHLRDSDPPRRDLPGPAWELIRQCDVVLHAGDVNEPGLLRRLNEVAPTHAVLGNNDLALVGHLPQTLQLALAGVRVAMVHDSGRRAGRPKRLWRRFPQADLVVFGHSHIPCDEVGIDGQVLFNPGSPTTRRSQPTCTLGRLVLAEGAIIGRSIIALDR